MILLGLLRFMFESVEPDVDKSLNFSSFVASYKPALRNKVMLRSALTYASLLAAMVSYLAASSFLLINHYQVPIEHYGYIQIPILSSYIAGGLSLRIYYAKSKQPQPLVIGKIFLSCSILLFSLIMLYFPQTPLFAFVIAVSFYCYAFGFVSSPLVVNTLTTHENKNSTAAVLGGLMALMSSLGSVAVTLFYSGNPMSLSFIMLGFILLAIWLYGPRHENRIGGYRKRFINLLITHNHHRRIE